MPTKSKGNGRGTVVNLPGSEALTASAKLSRALSGIPKLWKAALIVGAIGGVGWAARESLVTQDDVGDHGKRITTIEAEVRGMREDLQWLKRAVYMIAVGRGDRVQPPELEK